MNAAPATHRGAPVDVERLNAVAPPRDGSWPFPFLIVPGYTPRRGWTRGLHPLAIERLERARRDLEAGLAPAVIVSGGAVYTDENEAILMREWLLAREVAPSRILIEPRARHSTTNLRNAGRLLLERGAREALVVTSDGPGARRFTTQANYFGHPWLSTFHLRCLWELGHLVGELEWLSPMHVRFRPSPACARDATFSRRGR